MENKKLGLISLLLLLLLFPLQVISQPYDNILKQFVDHPFMAVDFIDIDDSQWFTVKTEANQFVKDTILLVSAPQVAGKNPVVVRMKNATTLNADKTVTFTIKVVQPNDSFCSKKWYIPQPLSPMQVAWLVMEVGSYNISKFTFIAGKGQLGRKSWSTTATFTNENLVAIWFPTGCVSSTEFCVLNHASRGAINLLQSNNNVKEAGKTLYLSVRSKSIDQRRGQWVLVPHDVNSTTSASYHVLAEETLGYLAFPTGIKVACLEKMVLETALQVTDYVPKKLTYQTVYDYPPGLFGMIGTITSLCNTVLVSSNWTTTSGVFAINEDQCVKEEFKHITPESIFLLVIGEQQTTTSTYECKVNFNSALDPTSAPTTDPTFAPSANPSVDPTFAPSHLPTFAPTFAPSANPTFVPSVDPTFVPSVDPTFVPSVDPTFVPSVDPTFVPSANPTFVPSVDPTFVPSVDPTFVPSVDPTFIPSVDPTFVPSVDPTFVPSVDPTFIPSVDPTFVPSVDPTISPTLFPSGGPTPYPTLFPTFSPSVDPTFVPSVDPTFAPSANPTFVPSVSPTFVPSVEPTFVPSVDPTFVPSVSPTFVPSVSPTFVPSVSPTFVPSVNPTFVPSVSPSFKPTTKPSVSPTFLPSATPSIAPTLKPTMSQFCFQIFLWDSFGDYWNNLRFVIRANDGSFVYFFNKTCECADTAKVCFEDPNVDFNMTIEVINPSKPVRHGWEAFFKYVDPITGITYYGKQGSVIRVRDVEVIYTSNLVNTNPEAEENQCERCEHPPPPKPKSDDPSKPEAPSSTPSPHHHDHRRILGASSNESDDNGGGSGPGKGGGGGDGKPKRPPLKFPFALFDKDGDGWYKGNGTEEVCPGIPESQMSSIVTYPRYYITNGERTTLIHEGTICGSFSTEACVEVLPYDGKFVFRVAGYADDPNEVSWNFCGESGILGEELQFEMVKGKCVAVEKRSANDYCEGIESISVWSGSMLLLSSFPYSSYSSSSSSSSSSLAIDDSKVLEKTLSEVLFHSEVHIESLVADESGLTVSFTSMIILEKLGYVGVYPDEVEVAEEFIETSMENAVSNGVVLASFQNALSNNPSLSAEAVRQTTSVTLLEFEMTSLSYRTKTNSNPNNNNDLNDPNQNNNDKNGDENDEGEGGNNNKNNEGKSVMDELQHISLIGYISGGVALIFIGMLAVIIIKVNSSHSEDHSQVQDLPERSSHSLLERNDRSPTFDPNTEVFRFR